MALSSELLGNGMPLDGKSATLNSVGTKTNLILVPVATSKASKVRILRFKPYAADLPLVMAPKATMESTKTKRLCRCKLVVLEAHLAKWTRA